MASSENDLLARPLTFEEANGIAELNTMRATTSSIEFDSLLEAEAKLLDSTLDTICVLFPSPFKSIPRKKDAYSALKALPIARDLPLEWQYTEPGVADKLVELSHQQVSFDDSMNFLYDAKPKRSRWPRLQIKTRTDAELTLAHDTCRRLAGDLSVTVQDTEAFRESGSLFGGWLALPKGFRWKVSSMYAKLCESAKKVVETVPVDVPLFAYYLRESVCKFDYMRALTQPTVFEPTGRLDLINVLKRWDEMARQNISARMALPPIARLGTRSSGSLPPPYDASPVCLTPCATTPEFRPKYESPPTYRDAITTRTTRQPSTRSHSSTLW